MANKGQFFTTNIGLKEKLYSFIKNQPSLILEPSIGQGDLVVFVKERLPDVVFDMYEIDETVKLLPQLESEKQNITYTDFMAINTVNPLSCKNHNKQYQTIIGNPPYVKLGGSNLYIDFTRKCYNLLLPKGELIFIVPSDFFKKTSASKLLIEMLQDGNFTHIYHPHDEKLFVGASIDIIIFRYCKDPDLVKTTYYNDTEMNLNNSKGLITFNPISRLALPVQVNPEILSTLFNIYVGMVSGKEEVFKNDIGSTLVLNGKDKLDKYIFINEYPSGDDTIDSYLLQHKEVLMKRAIRKFNEKNWFEWGAPRNMKKIEENKGVACIYIKTLTRDKEVAWKGVVGNFGGGLLVLIPIQDTIDLDATVAFLNSDNFKNNFLFAKRFKIGQRQLANCFLG